MYHAQGRAWTAFTLINIFLDDGCAFKKARSEWQQEILRNSFICDSSDIVEFFHCETFRSKKVKADLNREFYGRLITGFTTLCSGRRHRVGHATPCISGTNVSLTGRFPTSPGIWGNGGVLSDAATRFQPSLDRRVDDNLTWTCVPVRSMSAG